MAESAEPRIGKFDILATYSHVEALADGLSEDEAKARGLDVAVRCAQIHKGVTRKSDQEPASKKKPSTLTAAAFDQRVASKMGPYFAKTFLPTVLRLVEAGLSYDDVKRAVR